jgi:hypothetical protein
MTCFGRDPRSSKDVDDMLGLVSRSVLCVGVRNSRGQVIAVLQVRVSVRM